MLGFSCKVFLTLHFFMFCPLCWISALKSEVGWCISWIVRLNNAHLFYLLSLSSVDSPSQKVKSGCPCSVLLAVSWKIGWYLTLPEMRTPTKGFTSFQYRRCKHLMSVLLVGSWAMKLICYAWFCIFPKYWVRLPFVCPVPNLLHSTPNISWIAESEHGVLCFVPSIVFPTVSATSQDRQSRNSMFSPVYNLASCKFSCVSRNRNSDHLSSCHTCCIENSQRTLCLHKPRKHSCMFCSPAGAHIPNLASPGGLVQLYKPLKWTAARLIRLVY